MDYPETLAWLFEQLPMYQRVGKAAYKANLQTSIDLAKALGNPEKDLPAVHIAGTNGKGSTAHYIASILQENGYTVGLHCSPHYFDFRERIKINGAMVDEDFVIQFVEKYRSVHHDLQPSFFELTVLMAFSYFQEQKVDIAIIETGMGGRLDTTNIIHPLVSVITNIGMDHTQFLGDTIEKIAIEKAGIIKRNTPIVLGEMDIAAMEIMYAVADEKNAEVHLSAAFDAVETPTVFQKENMATAVTTVQVLETLGWNISEGSLKKGIEQVASNTAFMGRWQQVEFNPPVFVDSAHNADGIRALVDTIGHYTYDNLRIVLGMVEDKDGDSVLDLLPVEATYYFCKANILRAKSAETLKTEAAEKGLKGSVYPTVERAYFYALKDAGEADLVVVVGSIFVVGEVLEVVAR